ncbi:MAG: hypothetical protein KDE27_04745 [Planctomycetes bacterium]|nr:hypothetical protein [Planctomycetota bacterium]
MHTLDRLSSLCCFLACATSLSAQTTLSNFTGPTADGWSGAIGTATVFPNGSTAVAGVNSLGNDVLELTDGGFGGGAYRTYTGLPTSGFVTISVLGRIVTDPVGATAGGTLSPDPNSNPGQFGASFGIAAGNSGLVDQEFGYGASLGTAANDTGQNFKRYAATVRADGSGEFTAFFTPDQLDATVPGGTWVVQFDDVVLVSDCNAETMLSDFSSGTDGWASLDASNSPFGSAFTTVAHGAGELVLTDAGFTGGAYKTYTGAATVPGVHNILVDVRIATDNGTIDRARIAAVAGGATTSFSDLSFSQSFSTTADDSGQAYAQFAVPVITTGPSDVTVYVLPDYDANIGGGGWDIRIDNVQISSPVNASTAFSSACAAGHHSFGGPVLSFGGVPSLGTNFTINGGNLAGTPLCALLFGFEIPPIDLTIYGSFAGSQGCVQALDTVLCSTFPTASFTIAIPADPSFCGLPLTAQWVDYDPTLVSGSVPLPLGTSRAGTFTIGM